MSRDAVARPGFAKAQVQRRVSNEPMSDREIANRLTCIDSLKPSLKPIQFIHRTKHEKIISTWLFIPNILEFKAKALTGHGTRRGEENQTVKEMGRQHNIILSE